MGLFRKFFYKKPPDGLLEISERVYVFDYCFTTDVLEEGKYKVYVGGIIRQLRDHFPDASFMVFNFREGDNQSQIASILCEYDMTVMDYPRQYEGCPLLTMEMVHHYLRSGESWLELGRQNVLLMHCERSGWPVLAFMLAALLIYRKQYTGEQKTLDMIYKQANRELLQLMSPLNPLPSQLRYLQYISRRNVGSEWPPLDRALTLDCVIIRFIPNMDGDGGCRPIFRIYGPDPFMAADRTPKVLFSTPKRSKLVRHYKQADCELVKIDIHCHVQGDVVLECISLGDDLEREQMMFRVMFNTAFIRSNILMLNHDEIDISWNIAKDQFPKNFRVEVLFSDMDASSSVISIDLPRIEDKEGLPVEAFAKVQEIFSNVDWLDSKTEVANVLQQITASNILLERLDSGAATSSLLKESLSGKFKLEPKRLPENYIKSLESTVQGKTSLSSFESSVDTSPKKKIELLESMASSENKITTPASIGQEKQSVPSVGLSTASNILLENLDSGVSAATSCLPKESLSGKLELESKRLPESDTRSLVSTVQGKPSISSFESSVETSREKKTEPFESNASSENSKMSPASKGQGKQSVCSVGLSTASNVLSENLDGEVSAATSRLPKESLSGKFELEPKRLTENDTKSLAPTIQGKPSISSFESSVETSFEKKIQPLESKASSENSLMSPAPIGQGTQSVTSVGLSTASNILQEQLDSAVSAATNRLPKESLSGKFELEPKRLPKNDIKNLASKVQGKPSISSFESSVETSFEKKIQPLESKASSENSSTRPAPIGLGTQSVTSVGLSTASNILQEKLDGGVSPATSRFPKESFSGKFELEPKRLTENDTKSLAPTIRWKPSISSFESSVETSFEKKIQPLESKASSENSLSPAPIGLGTQSVTSVGLSTASNILQEQLGSVVSAATNRLPKESLSGKFELEPKRLPENDIKNLASKVQGKPSISSFESSVETSLEKKIEPLESKTSSENNIRSPASISQGKQCVPSVGLSTASNILPEKLDSGVSPATSSFSKESLSGKFELEPKRLPESDIKNLASKVQGKPSISSFQSSVDTSPNQKIETIVSKASSESNIKNPASTGQGKYSVPSVGLLTDSDSTKTKIESLESKSLLEYNTKCLTLMDQGKQSTPLIEPAMDENSIKKKTEPLESMALSENDIKSPTSSVQLKQSIPSFQPAIDANSIKKKIEPQELQVVLQLPAQSKIISPRVRQASRSAPVLYCNSLQGSPVPISRYHSAPSVLGITALLQDHTVMDTKEEVTHAVVVSPPSSTVSPSVSKVPKSVEPSSTRVPPASPPALLPSLSLKSSVDAPAAIEKTFRPLAPTTAASPPSPCPPQLHQPTSKLMQSVVIQHHEDTMHDRSQKSLVSPPLPPPPPLPGVIKSSFANPPPTIPAPPPPPTSSSMKSSFSTPPLPPSAPPSTSSFPGTSPYSTVKDSVITPPPPPPPPPRTSTGQTSFSTSPSPPSSESMNNSAIMSGPPPPPPPPRHSGITSGPVLTSSVPPPPPPPNSASRNSVSKNCTTVPPVPPPPSPSPNGLSKAGTASLQSHPSVGNGNVPPPVPGPPSGVPFGAKGRGLLRANPKSQTQTKRSNLKPYHWLKLTRAMQGSLWAETQKLDDASKAPEFDMSELESLFSAVAPNSDHGSKGGKSNRRASGPKATKVQLIELRRAYNCEIMLSKVKIPMPDVMSSLLALDDSALDVDQVENLIKFCPTKEEMELLKGYNGDKDNLGKCEQFFLELMKVPRVECKLRVFSFKIQFCSQVSELRRDLNIVNSASEEIRNSVKLKRIMQTILSLGNALNHGTARGSAIGFRLDSLLKLTDTRARNNKMTLMHYLCKVLAEKLPELLDFPKNLVCLEASTKIQLKYLAEEMQAISKGLEKVVQELTASENDGPVSENFCKILKEFLCDAEAEVRSLAQLYSNVGRNADALALYFGEDPARCPFEQVVSTLHNFVRMFVRAHVENCKQLEFERKRAEKEAGQEKLKLAAKKESEQMIRTPIKSGNIK